MLSLLTIGDFLASPLGIILIIVVLLAVFIFIIGYVKAPPDMAYIISGLKHKSKVVIGRASFRFPFFERMDRLNLRLIPIDVKTSNAVPTADYININVDATVNVKISNEPDKLRLAAENFLNKPTDYVAAVAREVLEGNVREIVGKMKLEEMVSDRQKFANLVKENAEPDLAAMGLDIISFNVQNFVDGNEVIENLGIDNIVKIKKAAAIARAESERDIKVAQAAADKESNDAAVLAQ
ncbi:MAG: flotillin family protein, partial [Lachnospiraceae bacterium]|nr:flotillin family protein [Lachnospiraceae bacterium]